MENVPTGVSYKSDRWLTPGVIIAAIVVSGLILAVVAASVAYLTAQGLDPSPMLKLVTTAGTGLLALLNIVLTISGRTTATKTERNTGILAAGLPEVASTVYDVADHLAARANPAAPPMTSAAPKLPPVPSSVAR
jgi:phosphotransferase system  glucose/maltose/N-acetylglucosamine-specific IIC component